MKAVYIVRNTARRFNDVLDAAVVAASRRLSIPSRVVWQAVWVTTVTELAFLGSLCYILSSEALLYAIEAAAVISFVILVGGGAVCNLINIAHESIREADESAFYLWAVEEAARLADEEDLNEEGEDEDDDWDEEDEDGENAR